MAQPTHLRHAAGPAALVSASASRNHARHHVASPLKTRAVRCSAQDSEGARLASEFGAYISAAGLLSPAQQTRRPTHLIPPGAAVAAQLDALQRNDWPEPDDGVRTAFAFARPAADPVGPARARSWQAAEEYLDLEAFSAMLHLPPYSAMLGCDSWRPTSDVRFPSQRHQGKAVMAVEVVGRRQGAALRPLAFTFCLERAVAGPLRDCWLTVGVRVGDYASV